MIFNNQSVLASFNLNTLKSFCLFFLSLCEEAKIDKILVGSKNNFGQGGSMQLVDPD